MAAENVDLYDTSGLAERCLNAATEMSDEVWNAQSEAGNTLHASVINFGDAVHRLRQAKARAAQVLADPTLADTYKEQMARTLVAPALDAANTAHAAFSSALDAAPAALYQQILPQKPSHPDRQELMGFKAEQATKYLEALGGNTSLEKAMAAGKLLETALAQGDDTMAYVIAGGPLELVYARLGITNAELMPWFTQAILKTDPDRRKKGAKLLARVTPTPYKGPGYKGDLHTLHALRVMASSYLYHQQEAYAASLPRYVYSR